MPTMSGPEARCERSSAARQHERKGAKMIKCRSRGAGLAGRRLGQFGARLQIHNGLASSCNVMWCSSTRKGSASVSYARPEGYLSLSRQLSDTVAPLSTVRGGRRRNEQGGLVVFLGVMSWGDSRLGPEKKTPLPSP